MSLNYIKDIILVKISIFSEKRTSEFLLTLTLIPGAHSHLSLQQLACRQKVTTANIVAQTAGSKASSKSCLAVLIPLHVNLHFEGQKVDYTVTEQRGCTRNHTDQNPFIFSLAEVTTHKTQHNEVSDAFMVGFDMLDNMLTSLYNSRRRGK